MSPFRGERFPAVLYTLATPCPNSETRNMGHTYTSLVTHIIFSTKDRLPYLLDERRHDVFAYMGGIVRDLKGAAINVNGAQDHVHLLVRLPSLLAVAKVVELVKTNSSRWIHEKRVLHRTFSWQAGYAAFSVSESQVDNVSRYLTKHLEVNLSPLKGLVSFTKHKPRPLAVATILRRSAAENIQQPLRGYPLISPARLGA